LTRLPNEALELLGSTLDLEILQLENCNLFSLPDIIFEMRNLKCLNVSHNNISSLSGKIGNLSKLEKLNLVSNKLTVLPDELFSLINLKSLFMGNFKFCGLICVCCDYIGQKTTGNDIPYISRNIQKLQKLETLMISSMGLKALPVELGNIPSLLSIYCAHNDIYHIPDKILALPNLKNNGLLVFGNPVIKKLPFMQYHGLLRNRIYVLDQMTLHLQYCTVPGKAFSFAGNAFFGFGLRSIESLLEGASQFTQWACKHPAASAFTIVSAATTLTYLYNTQNQTMEERLQNFLALNAEPPPFSMF
jgi:hypothetical protein